MKAQRFIYKWQKSIKGNIMYFSSWNILFTAINVLHVVGKQYVKQVDRCPTENEWEEKVKTFTGVCQESRQYHCLRSTNGSWIEACMYKDKIMRDKCLQLGFNGEEPIFNNAGYDCRSGSDMSCPKLGETYWSNEIYKFPGCFNAVTERTTSPGPNTEGSDRTTSPGPNAGGSDRTTSPGVYAGGSDGSNLAKILVPVFVGICILCGVFVFVWCKRRPNSRKEKQQSSDSSRGNYHPVNGSRSQTDGIDTDAPADQNLVNDNGETNNEPNAAPPVTLIFKDSNVNIGNDGKIVISEHE